MRGVIGRGWQVPRMGNPYLGFLLTHVERDGSFFVEDEGARVSTHGFTDLEFAATLAIAVELNKLSDALDRIASHFEGEA